MDTIAEAGASNDVDMNATQDVQRKAAKNALGNASTLALRNTDKDAGHSTRQLIDPYSILAEEGVASQEPLPIRTAEEVTMHEVLHRPWGMGEGIRGFHLYMH